MTTLKQPLKLKKISKNPYYINMPWSSCLPFVDNRLALLIHRPRSIETVKAIGKNMREFSNVGITYWCGNSHNGTDKFTFLSTWPETGKLLCARCEANAVASGMPSASELVGHHVHAGKLRAVRTCCGNG